MYTDIEGRTALRKGAYLLKYGRRGRPHLSFFRLSEDGNYLEFSSLASSDRIRRIPLASVDEIWKGQSTPVFRRFPRAELEHLSFSLIYENKERSLDVICSDEEEYYLWLTGIRSVIREIREVMSKNSATSQINRRNSTRASLTLDPSASLPPNFRLSDLPSAKYEEQKSLRLEEEPRDLFIFGETPCSSPLDQQRLVPKRCPGGAGLDVVIVECSDAYCAMVVGKDRDKLYEWGVLGSNQSSQEGSKAGEDTRRLTNNERKRLTPALYEGFQNLKEGEISAIGMGKNFGIIVAKESGRCFSFGDADQAGNCLGLESSRKSTMRYFPWQPSITPKQVTAGGLDLHRVIGVSCGPWSVAVWTITGELYTWGEGAFGVLGHGSQESSDIPRRVDSLGIEDGAVLQAACGRWHTAAIVESNDNSRNLFTWGSNESGQLGLTDCQEPIVLVPQKVEGFSNAVKVAVGNKFSCLLLDDGALLTCGKNRSGVLGRTEGSSKKFCRVVSGDLHSEGIVKHVACGAEHVAAVYCDGQSSGQLLVWGEGNKGQLGLFPPPPEQPTPRIVPSFYEVVVSDVSCGSAWTAVIVQSVVKPQSPEARGRRRNVTVHELAQEAGIGVHGTDKNKDKADSLVVATSKGSAAASGLVAISAAMKWNRLNKEKAELGNQSNPAESMESSVSFSRAEAIPKKSNISKFLHGPPYHEMTSQEHKILRERNMEYINDLECHGTDYSMRPWAFASAKKVAEKLRKSCEEDQNAKEAKNFQHSSQFSHQYRSFAVLEKPSFSISEYKGSGYEDSGYADGSEADLSDLIKRLAAHNRFLESELRKRSMQVSELEEELSALKIRKFPDQGSPNDPLSENKHRHNLLHSEFSEDSLPDDSQSIGQDCIDADMEKFNMKAPDSSDINEIIGVQPFSTRSFGSVSSTATNHTDPGVHVASPILHSVERTTKDDGDIDSDSTPGARNYNQYAVTPQAATQIQRFYELMAQYTVSNSDDAEDDNNLSQVDPELVNRISFSPEDSKTGSDPNTPGNLSLQNVQHLSNQGDDVCPPSNFDDESEQSSDAALGPQELIAKHPELSNGFATAQVLDGANHKEPANFEVPQPDKENSTNGENSLQRLSRTPRSSIHQQQNSNTLADKTYTDDGKVRRKEIEEGVTIELRKNSTNSVWELERILFSRKHFNKEAAEAWWTGKREPTLKNLGIELSTKKVISKLID